MAGAGAGPGVERSEGGSDSFMRSRQELQSAPSFAELTGVDSALADLVVDPADGPLGSGFGDADAEATDIEEVPTRSDSMPPVILCHESGASITAG